MSSMAHNYNESRLDGTLANLSDWPSRGLFTVSMRVKQAMKMASSVSIADGWNELRLEANNTRQVVI